MERILHFFTQYPIDLVAHLSSIFPIVTGIFRYKYMPDNLRIIWLFFSINFLKDTYSLILIFTVPNNLYLQNVESIYQTLLVGIIFCASFDGLFERRLIAVFTVVSTLLASVYYEQNEVSSVSLTVFRVFSIALSLAYFSKTVMDMRVRNMMKHSMFWFTSGLLIYATGTFFAMLLSEYWYQGITKIPVKVFDKYWNSSQILLILFALLSAIGIWFCKCDRENLI